MDGIEISSTVIFLENQSDPSIPIFIFSYNVEIKNNLDVAIQLISRHWEITDGNGTVKNATCKCVVVPVSYTHLTLPTIYTV